MLDTILVFAGGFVLKSLIAPTPKFDAAMKAIYAKAYNWVARKINYGAGA